MEEKDKSIKSNYRVRYTPGTWSLGSWQFSDSSGNIDYSQFASVTSTTFDDTSIKVPDDKEEPEFINKLEGEYITAS